MTELHSVMTELHSNVLFSISPHHLARQGDPYGVGGFSHQTLKSAPAIPDCLFQLSFSRASITEY